MSPGADGTPGGGLLAVDLGLRTGLALYGADGRLVWYRARNFGSFARLRRGAGGVLDGAAGLRLVLLEGGGPAAEVWEREALRRGLEVRTVQADQWRRALLYARERRTGPLAKESAEGLARRVIEWSGARRPATDLRHDASEAILLGLWGVVEAGWLPRVPPEVRRHVL